MDKVFNIKLNEYVVHLLPTVLRKTRMVHWLLCQIKPLQELHTKFMALRADATYKIEHTPQVYSMVNVLNDAFDLGQRRIRIVDGVYKSPVYFYEPEETSPVHFYEPEEENFVYFYEPEELELLDVDFIVLLPQGLSLTDSEMIRLRALVDFYRSPDKTYEIRYNDE